MKSYVKFKIEKEVKWDANKMDMVTKYFVWAGSNCLALKYTEEEALEAYEAIKASFKTGGTTVIKEEEVDYES
jgi:hypothetical protein